VMDSSSVIGRSVPFLAPERRYPSDAANVNLARFLQGNESRAGGGA